MIASAPIKPIRTKADYRAAMARIDEIIRADEDDRDYDVLDVLSVLVARYEDEHHPIDPPDPVDAIIFRLDQAGLTRRDLERHLGSRQRVSEVLNRKRPLSIAMIRALHDGLGIPAESLIRPLARQRRRRARA